MAHRRSGLSRDEHREIGDRLKPAREVLLDAASKVGSAYPKASRESKAVSNALRALDRAKCVLDDTVIRENPRNHEVFGFYYGDRHAKASDTGTAV